MSNSKHTYSKQLLGLADVYACSSMSFSPKALEEASKALRKVKSQEDLDAMTAEIACVFVQEAANTLERREIQRISGIEEPA